MAAPEGSRIPFPLFVQQIAGHDVDVMGAFALEGIAMGSSSLSSGELGSDIVLEVCSIIARLGLLGFFVEKKKWIFRNRWLFPVALQRQDSENPHILNSSSHQMHMRKSSQVVIRCVVSSEVLELKVFFPE